MSHFDNAFFHIMKVEGGSRYTNHPNDNGGPTKWGITLGRLKSWRRDRSLTAKDVRNLQQNEAMKIYKVDYWNKWVLDEITDESIAIALLDHCVNAGTGKSSVRRVQRALNKRSFGLSVDGVIGPKTLAALNRVDTSLFILEFVKEIQIFYARIVQRNKSQAVFLVGWLRRSHTLLDLI